MKKYFPFPAAFLVFTAPLHAAMRSGKAQAPASPGQVPTGPAPSDWATLRARYEAGRHSFQPLGDGFQARNPGQQWVTTFDKHGFLVQPATGGWQWGLALQSYGFTGQERSMGVTPIMRPQGKRLTYQWDNIVEEWFVNDPRGLEHGFTVQTRPAADPLDSQPSILNFLLGTRGNLTCRVARDGQAATFQDPAGTTVVNYSGLKVWDADGKILPSHFTAAGTKMRLVVDQRGARYPITIDPIAQQAYLKASNADADDYFGQSVAVSGDTLVIGASGEDSNATGINSNQGDNSGSNSGAAYVMVRSGTDWVQQAYLKASNTGNNDNFGGAVAISGNTIVIGAPGERSNATGENGNQTNDSSSNSGAAYVFIRTGTTWTQQAYLKASNTGNDDRFGGGVAVSADTIVIGASGEASNATGINGDQTNNSATYAGAAYIFTRNSTGWTQQAYLKASNSGAGDFFGQRVAVSGGTVVIGALQESSNALGVNGDQTDNTATAAGAVYVFIRNGTDWMQQAYLKATNTQAYDQFSSSLAISGNTIVVGANGESSSAAGVNGDQADNSAGASGAAYVFTRSGAAWMQEAYLKASNPGPLDFFGDSAGIDGDVIIVGAGEEDSSAMGVNGSQADNSTFGAGAAYVFTRSGTAWTQQSYLKPGNTGESDNFGISAAVSGDTVIIGASREASKASGVNGDHTDNTAPNAGAAYAFHGANFSPSPDIRILATNKTGTTFAIQFTSKPGLNGWRLKGSAALGSFPDDLTAVTTFTEVSPGYYQSVTNLTGYPAFRYFLRIER